MSVESDFETAYERALAAVKKRKDPARFARLSLPQKYARIHNEIPEFEEVLRLVDSHGLFLVTESLAQIGFRNAKVAWRALDRNYAEDLHMVSTHLMKVMSSHNVAVNQIAGTRSRPPSDKEMSRIVDAIGFHEVIMALAASAWMMSENVLQLGDKATSSMILALKRDLEKVSREAKLLVYK